MALVDVKIRQNFITTDLFALYQQVYFGSDIKAACKKTVVVAQDVRGAHRKLGT